MTGLTALNSLFLWLLPLIALPVLFHLFFRLRKQVRPFPTLMLFHRIDPRLNARRRLREWLVLLLRTLLILLLLLALARPVWRGIGKQGTAAVVLVIDNSGSMGGTAADGAGSRLQEAVDAARGVVAQLRGRDAAGIVLFANDPNVPLPAGLTSDKAILRNALDHIHETEASGSVAAAVDRATAMLAHSPATHFEIHILSDLQALKWRQPPVNLRAPPLGTSIVVHRLAARQPQSNVALSGARIVAGNVLPGRRLPVAVRLLSTTPSGSHVRLNWLDDSGERGSQEISVAPDAEQNTSILLPPQNPGFRWVSFRIEGDDFEADNRAFIGFVCQQRRSVLFGGDAAEFGDLPLAISPGGGGRLSGMIPAFNSDWVAGLRNHPAQFLVLTWDSMAADPAARWGALRQYLEAGGRALIVPAAGSLSDYGTPPDWVTVVPGGLTEATNGVVLGVLDKASAIFNDLRDARGDVALHNVRVFRFHPIHVGRNTAPVLGVDGGRVVLAGEKIGKGRLLAGGFAFDSAWSTLPLKPGFIALAQNMAAQSAAGTNLLSLAAGEPLRLGWPDAAPIEVRSLGGSPLDWKGKAGQLPSLPRSGVYAVQHGGETRYLAIRASAKEGRQEFIDGDVLPAMGKLAYTVRRFAGNEGLISEFRRLEKSLDLSPLLLLLAFAALLAEGWLANPPPIKAKAPRETAPGTQTPSRENVAA